MNVAVIGTFSASCRMCEALFTCVQRLKTHRADCILVASLCHLLPAGVDEDEGKGKEAEGKDWEKMAQAADTELPGLQEVRTGLADDGVYGLSHTSMHLWNVGQHPRLCSSAKNDAVEFLVVLCCMSLGSAVYTEASADPTLTS